jgi:hypothetical protein
MTLTSPRLPSALRRSFKPLVIAASLLPLVGCFGYERSSTLGPSATGAAALLGSWSSSDLIPAAESCTDFKWDVTEQSGNSASGSFSATCANDIRVQGTATGTLTGSTVNWSAQATASVANIASCPITLTGTAEILVDAIRVPYSGQTCLGPVSGVETLRKR